MSSADGGPTATDDGTEAEAVEPDTRRDGAVERLRAALGEAVVDAHVDPGVEAWARVTPGGWEPAARVARDTLGCTFFDFLSAIDWMPSPYGRDMDSQVDLEVGVAGDAEDETVDEGADAGGYTPVAGATSRFQLIARVHNPEEHFGLILKCDLDDDTPSAATWSGVYAGADWHEREAYEMFGIDFPGHPDLHNLYLPTGFEGHPLRKDFPLLSRRVKPWPGIVDVEPMPGDDEAEAGDGGAA